MSDSPVQRFYRYHACIYDCTRWLILHGRRQAVAALALQPDSQVLEVGCGTGLNFRYIAERLDPTRGSLTGVDFSRDMLARAARRVAACGWPHVELVQDDAATLDLDRRLDAILFAYSLTMIPDWPAAIERTYAHLRPGGRLVVLDFGTFHAWGPLAAVLRGWLRLNHVETCRPYVEKLREVFGTVQTRHWLGGYNFTAVTRRSA